MTTTDLSAIWTAGDSVMVVGKNYVGIGDATYTIGSMSGTTLTLSANLDYAVLAGARIINLSRKAKLGLSLTATVDRLFFDTQDSSGGMHQYLQVVGLHIKNIALNAIVKDAVAITPDTYRSILIERTVSANSYSGIAYLNSNNNTTVPVFSNIHSYATAGSYNQSAFNL